MSHAGLLPGVDEETLAEVNLTLTTRRSRAVRLVQSRLCLQQELRLQCVCEIVHPVELNK